MFSRTLKRLLVFEDFNDDFTAAMSHTPLREPFLVGSVDIGGASRIMETTIDAASASRSRGREQLSVSYMASAEGFFHTCMPAWTWPDLQSLSLKLQLLQHTESHKKIRALLCEVGTVALRMSRLQTLQIWNGAKRNACVFIYEANRGGGAYICAVHGIWS